MSYTTGKWEANIDHDKRAGNYPKTAITSNGKLVAKCYEKEWLIGSQEAEANASLIASAPLLLEALIKCQYQLQTWAESDAWSNDDEEAYELAATAIANAGENELTNQ